MEEKEIGEVRLQKSRPDSKNLVYHGKGYRYDSAESQYILMSMVSTPCTFN